jgi:hypothetical protein
MYDDMYSLEEFVREKVDQARNKELQCEELNITNGAIRYHGMKDAYQVVLNKIQSARMNQRPHIKICDVRTSDGTRDIDYVF